MLIKHNQTLAHNVHAKTTFTPNYHQKIERPFVMQFYTEESLSPSQRCEIQCTLRPARAIQAHSHTNANTSTAARRLAFPESARNEVRPRVVTEALSVVDRDFSNRYRCSTMEYVTRRWN